MIITYSQMHRTENYSQGSWIIWPVWLTRVGIQTKWLWVRISLQSLKLWIRRLLWVRCFLTFRETVECGFTLKLVHDMITTYSQMHRTDRYSQHRSIIWPVWLNGWVFSDELGGCGFESCSCHLGLRRFLATESPSKMMKNVLYFTLEVIFVFKIFKFLCWLF